MNITAVMVGPENMFGQKVMATLVLVRVQDLMSII